MLSFIYTKCLKIGLYFECDYPECRYDECLHGECSGACYLVSLSVMKKKVL
jgi:hypothetical protein